MSCSSMMVRSPLFSCNSTSVTVDCLMLKCRTSFEYIRFMSFFNGMSVATYSVGISLAETWKALPSVRLLPVTLFIIKVAAPLQLL